MSALLTSVPYSTWPKVLVPPREPLQVELAKVRKLFHPVKESELLQELWPEV
jgi:hypothetical protein